MQDTTIVPAGQKWEFDENVAAVFDNMLERSIPSYDAMRELVKRIGCRYVRLNTAIVDIGCSNGNAIEPFINTYGPDNQYFLYDVSEAMLQRCHERYDSICNVKIENYDIRHGIPACNASLILSVLTLQFTPIEYRQRIIQSLYDNLISGGALIIVEKVLGNTAELDDLFVDEYYRIKTDNAYTQEQIQTKRKSLEGVLVPITAAWNEDLMRTSGFRQIDCFWRCLNFAAWVAIK